MELDDKTIKEQIEKSFATNVKILDYSFSPEHLSVKLEVDAEGLPTNRFRIIYSKRADTTSIIFIESKGNTEEPKVVAGIDSEFLKILNWLTYSICGAFARLHELYLSMQQGGT